MNITVNGKPETVSVDTIAAYVQDKGLEPKTLVVEHNGQIIMADRWQVTLLSEGDQLELLSFVGGG